MLEGGLEEIELTPISITNNELGIHAHEIVPQLVQQKPNGPTSRASGALPGRVGLVVGGGGGGQGAQQLGVNLGAISTSVRVAGINVFHKRPQVGVLS